MTTDRPSRKAEPDARAARLKAALKANIARRKAQAAARSEGDTEERQEPRDDGAR